MAEHRTALEPDGDATRVTCSCTWSALYANEPWADEAARRHELEGGTPDFSRGRSW